MKESWDFLEFTIAGHYLSALINGDTSGLEDQEIKDLETFEQNAYSVAKSCKAVAWHWSIDTECANFARCEVSNLFASVFDVSLHFKIK